MKNILFKAGVILFGIVLMTNLSYGQSNYKPQEKKPPNYKQLLKEMDKNEDGKLSSDEIKSPLKEDFSKVDTDEDGFITEEEFKKVPKPERKQKN